MRNAHGVGDLLKPPLHGNQGDREPIPVLESPLGLSIAVSREAGARGGSIARRVGKQLGWQVYTQELLEFMCNNEAARSHVLADVPDAAASWAESHLNRLRTGKIIHHAEGLGEMPRLIVTLAARGNVILVGRGAGHLLPRESTVHVRIVAPLVERIAYMAQWLRRTPEDAAEQVRERDEMRAEFLMKYFNRRVGDFHDYDLVLNSFLLGEETSADLLRMAIRAKEHQSHSEVEDD